MKKSLLEKDLRPSEIYEAAVSSLHSKDIDHHCSDLYLRRTPASTALVRRLDCTSLLAVFRDFNGDFWYELPFCYLPYWTEHLALVD